MSGEEVRSRDAEVEQEKKEDGCGGGILDSIGDFVEEVGQKLKSTFTFGKPDADVKRIHVPHLSMDDAQIIVDVEISNPNPVPIPLVDIDYLIEANGEKLVSGLIPDAGTIHAHGTEIVKIPVNINFKEIVDTFEDINPGQIVKYLIRVTLIIDVPVFGRFSIPLDTDGEIPIPEKPDVDLEKVKFEHLSLTETKCMLHLKVENFNPFDIDLNKLSADLKFAGVSVGEVVYDEVSNFKIEKGSDGPGPSGTGRVQVPFRFRPKDIGSALWDIVRGKDAVYSLSGSCEVDSPWGPLKMPFTKEGGKTKLRKEDDDSDDE